jgi:hypothetical protein
VNCTTAFRLAKVDGDGTMVMEVGANIAPVGLMFHTVGVGADSGVGTPRLYPCITLEVGIGVGVVTN